MRQRVGITVEHAFIQFVNSYAERHNLMLLPKIAIKSLKGTNIIPDSALKNALRLDFHYYDLGKGALCVGKEARYADAL